jgi:hypothetical protein
MKQLDLRKEFADIYRFIAGRVRSFDPSTNDGPGDGKLVTRVDIGYQCDQAGWVTLVFDTRPDAAPDGEWNSHITGNWLERPEWLDAVEANEDEPVQVVMPDGTERVIPPERSDEFTSILGDLLKSVLLQVRTDGVFERMAKAPRCELGVEEQDGNYGWPVYEERGQDNLA